jgi:hypothetical protein
MYSRAPGFPVFAQSSLQKAHNFSIKTYQGGTIYCHFNNSGSKISFGCILAGCAIFLFKVSYAAKQYKNYLRGIFVRHSY